jgi:hexosaminidase
MTRLETMKTTLSPLACVAALFVATAVHAASPPVLVPYPATVEARDGAFRLEGTIVLSVPPGDLEARGVALHLRDMLKGAGRRFVVSDRAPAAGQRAIVLARSAAAASDEAYTLDVAPDRVTISAASRKGLFYGTVTAWQLATQDNAAGLPAIHIADTPRYRWRGVLIDSARHFQSVAELKRLIDVMAMYKLNTLQWHLADDQGWRLEIKAFPKLTGIGARRDIKVAYPSRPIRYGGFYTQDQVRDLVAYAAARNITIVPEIELPGHATAALTAYPEFSTQGEVPQSGMSDWGVYSNLYSVDDKTFAFIDTVLDEVMDLFPSTYIHIGGDEAIKNQWQASPAVQAKMKALGLKDEDALQSWFIARVGRHIAARGRRMIGWDEILEGGIPGDAAVMSWRGLKGAKEAVRLGHDTVLTPAPDLYLDSRQSLSGDEPPGRSELSSLRNVYGFDTLAGEIPPEPYGRVLGIQANAWTEHMRTEAQLERMLFPRVVALSEVAWSPENARDWGRFSRDLPVTLAHLHRLGVGYDTVPFEPTVTLSRDNGGLTAALTSPLGVGDIRYTLDGSAPSAASPVYTQSLSFKAPARVNARTFLGITPLGAARSFDVSERAVDTRVSAELKPCGGSVPLHLEDDYPAAGDRAAVFVSIYKPCWVWSSADLSHGLKITARIGQMPFNFQLAGGRRIVQFDTPATSPYGELVVRRRRGDAMVCEGDTLAVLPLTRANDANPGPSEVSGTIPASPGTADLCLTFNRPSATILWAIDRLTLQPGG